MGNGRVYWKNSANRYLIDLTVVAVPTLEGNDEDLWKKSFKFASEYIFNASNKRMQLNKITFSETPIPNSDIKLINKTGGKSHTSFPSGGRAPGLETLGTECHLNYPAKTIPLVIAHELMHYIVFLADEYFLNAGVCTHNPETHACMMEFGKKYSKWINDDSTFSVETPDPHVFDLCKPTGTQTHLGGVSTSQYLVALNAQEHHYKESCWETLITHFPKVIDVNSNAHTGVDFVKPNPKSKLAIEVVNGQHLFDQQLSNSVIDAFFMAAGSTLGTQRTLRLSSDSPTQFSWGFQEISDDVALKSALDTIDKWGKSDFTPQELDQLKLRSAASFPADLRLFISSGQYFRSDKERTEVEWRERIDSLIEQQVEQRYVTFGDGEFATFLSKLNFLKPRFSHVHIPAVKDSSFYNFLMRGLCSESLIELDPSLSLLGSVKGSFPKELPKSFLAELDGEQQDEESSRNSSLDAVDRTVFVEEGVNQLRIWLHTNAESLEVQLFSPDGDEIALPATLARNNFRTDPTHFVSIAAPVASGRWKFRIRRV